MNARSHCLLGGIPLRSLLSPENGVELVDLFLWQHGVWWSQGWAPTAGGWMASGGCKVEGGRAQSADPASD